MNDLVKNKVMDLEAEIKQCYQAPMPVEHDFIPGVYARTMYLLKGTVLTGATHKQESFFVLRSGLLAVTTDFGEKLLGPGEMLKSSAGSKRAGLAFTDVVLTEFMHNPDNLTSEADIWELYAEDPMPNLLESKPMEVIA